MAESESVAPVVPPEPEQQPTRRYNFAGKRKNKSLFGKKKKNQKNSTTYTIYQDATATQSTTGTNLAEDVPGEDTPVDMDVEPSSSGPNSIYPTNRPRDYVQVTDNWKEARAIKSLENKLGREVKKRETAEKKAGVENAKRLKAAIDLKQEKKKSAAAEAKASTAKEQLKQSEQERMREKVVTRQLLEEGKLDAEALMEEAMEAMEQAAMEKRAALELKVSMERQCQEKLREERRHSSGNRAKADSTYQSKLDKDRWGYDALVDHLKEKHHRANERMKLKVEDLESEMVAQREKHKAELAAINSKLEKQKDLLHEEKVRRWKQAKDHQDMKDKLNGDILYLYDWLDEMADEVKEAKSDMKKAVKAANKSGTLAAKRLEQLKDLKFRVGQLKYDLADELKQRANLEKLNNIRLEIKRERAVGCCGGSGKWPVSIVLLICELLVNGTPPTAVQNNMKSFSARLHGQEDSQMPSVNFIRQCRVVLQNLNEMLAAYRFGLAEKWIELFTDGTARRQMAFQNLVIGLMNGDSFESVIASSCIVLENETAETTVEAVVNKV
jgi:hypothetical protein